VAEGVPPFGRRPLGGAAPVEAKGVSPVGRRPRIGTHRVRIQDPASGHTVPGAHPNLFPTARLGTSYGSA